MSACVSGCVSSPNFRKCVFIRHELMSKAGYRVGWRGVALVSVQQRSSVHE